MIVSIRLLELLLMEDDRCKQLEALPLISSAI